MIKSLKSWLNEQSLNFKLSVSILTCVGLVFLGLVFFISEKSEPIIKSQIEDVAQKTVESYVFDFNNLIEGTEQIILNTKNTLVQAKKDKAIYFQALLDSALTTTHLKISNAWIYVFPDENVTNGILYKSFVQKNGEIDFKSEEIGDFYDKFPWFTEVPKEEKIFWSEPYGDKNTDQTVITALIPFKFRDSKVFNGLVAITVNLSNIRDSVNGFSFYETGKLLLLSRLGLYVTHPNPDIALKTTIFDLAKKINLPELDYIGNELKAGKTGQKEISSSTVFDEKIVVFYAPIKSIGWSFCLIYQQNEFLKPLHHFKYIVFVALFISIILLLLIINKICKHSTTQLSALGMIASLYGSGNFSQVFGEEPSSKDVKIISKALADMRKNLLKHIEKEKQNAAETQKNASELEIARNIQNSALSVDFPQNNIFDIYALMKPAKQVGGDFYDFFYIDDNNFAIVIADVSGKGIPAALYMMKAQTLIKNIAKSKIDIADVFYKANNELCEGNDSCMFVTVFMAVINLSKGEVRCVNAGHIPPLLFDGFEYSSLSTHKNIVLGIRKNIKFVSDKFNILSDNRILLYTDGVTEAENLSSKFFGEKRLFKVLQKNKINPRENLNTILKSINKFAQNTAQSDDITMLEFVYKGENIENLTVAADLNNIKKIVDFLKNNMRKHQIVEKNQFKVVTSAEEIFSNIVQYAYDNLKNKKISITAQKENKFYCISFIDTGKKFNPLEQKMPDISVDIKDREVGGLGILLIKKLADDVQYQRIENKNMLKVYFKL
ncbi:MAG: SpoIIE family protein phosphatase [Alphaproteobacteria bacterium]|nr:SpoIIE family protein phosphatase [Alphaproteobacteria bacterium]